jgi:hypothetical protein
MHSILEKKGVHDNPKREHNLKGHFNSTAPHSEKDWWDSFKRAVENPKVNIYDFLKDSLRTSLEIHDDNAGDFSVYVRKARSKALREVIGLKSPAEIKKKLESLEKNTLLFNYQARVGLKVFRVLIDTYLATRQEIECLKQQKLSKDEVKVKTKQAIESLIENNPDISQLIREIQPAQSVLEKKDPGEVIKTLEEATRQIVEDKSISKMARDALIFTKKYMKPDNIVNIMIHGLPLITWQYRWALALGLGVYATRKSAVFGLKGIAQYMNGYKVKAKENGIKSLEALKAASGNVLIIGLSPAVARLPKFIIGFANWGIGVTYKSVVESFQEMMKEESDKPGSTPLSKSMKKGVKKFYKSHGDSLANNTVKALKSKVPNLITQSAAKIFKRLPLSKLLGVAQISLDLAFAFSKRGWRMLKSTLAQGLNDKSSQGSISTTDNKLNLTGSITTMSLDDGFYKNNVNSKRYELNKKQFSNHFYQNARFQTYKDSSKDNEIVLRGKPLMMTLDY